MKNTLRVRGLLLTLCFGLLAVLQAHSQMKIGNNPTKINKSSILELESDRQALLLPRLTTFNDINTIIGSETKSTLNGMMVYYTGSEAGYEGPGLYCYEQKTLGVYDWVKIASASDAANNWSLDGNTGTTAANFIGTTDAQPLVFKTNNAESFQITAAGKIKTASGTIAASTGNNELNVLVLGADGTINMRTLQADVFKNVVTGITDGTNMLTNTNVTLAADANTTNQEFKIVTDPATNTATVQAPIMDGTGTKTYGFMSLADWTKLNKLAGINGLSIGALITAAANDPETSAGAKITNDGAGNYEIHLIEADATHNGIMTTGTQTLAGDKTFNGNVGVGSQLTVTGGANLDGGATVGTAATNQNLTVNGNSVVTGDASIAGNTTLASSTGSKVVIDNLPTFTVPAGATTVPTLVIDGTNQVQKLDLSPAAFKPLQLGNTAGADPSNGASNGLNIDATGATLTLNVPDAAENVRGVVNTTTQTFQGDKTFSDNLNVTKNLAVTGTADVTGAATMTNTLDVTGATTLSSTLDVKDNATLDKSLTLTTVPTDAATATNYNVLVRNATTGVVENKTISADATLPLGIDADPSKHDLYIKRNADSILIEAPDAGTDVRGVVSIGKQTIGGEKTFASNTTIGDASDPTKTANLTVNGAVGMASTNISASTTLAGNAAKVHTILVDATGGNVTITLPTAAADLIPGMIYTIKIVKNDALNNVDINGPNEDGTNDIVFYNAGSSRTVQYNGTNSKWYIIGQ